MLEAYEMWDRDMKPVLKLKDSCKGCNLLVVADGPSKTEFGSIYLDMGEPHVMSINNAWKGLGIQPDYFATAHCDKNTLKTPYGRYSLDGLSDKCIVIGMRQDDNTRHERVDMLFYGEPRPCFGTSTMVGVLAGLWLGYDKVVIVGADMNTPPYGAEAKLKPWRELPDEVKQRVSAVGGGLEPIMGGYNVSVQNKKAQHLQGCE